MSDHQYRQDNTQPNMTPDDIKEVHTWFKRMRENTIRAINLSSQLLFDELNASNDLFWALAKYAENVQECAVELDNLDLSILDALEEVPLKSNQGEELTWKNMKGMRNIIAHQFWNITPRILWETSTRDFPILDSLLSRLIIGATPANPELTTLHFPAQRIIELPISQSGQEPRIGNCLIMMLFNLDGNAWCLRIARQSESRLLVKPPGNLEGSVMSISLLDSDQREFLGEIRL